MGPGGEAHHVWKASISFLRAKTGLNVDTRMVKSCITDNVKLASALIALSWIGRLSPSYGEKLIITL